MPVGNKLSKDVFRVVYKEIVSVDASDEGKVAIMGCSDGQIYIWNLNSKTLIRKTDTKLHSLKSVALSLIYRENNFKDDEIDNNDV